MEGISGVFGVDAAGDEKGQGDPEKGEGRGKSDTKDKRKVGNGGGVLEDMSDTCKLSWKARLIGFLVCALVGVVLVGLGYFFIMTHKIPPFAVTYSLGSVVAIMSTGFLVGPLRQFNAMLEKGRIVFTIIFVLAIVATIVTGVKKLLIPCVICMVVQVIAFILYSLTYIPVVGHFLRKTCPIPGL